MHICIYVYMYTSGQKYLILHRKLQGYKMVDPSTKYEKAVT